MANIIRLVNGSQVMVRTGVLAGVGPAGPPGPIGPPGITGDQGPKGDAGPPGAVTQYMTRVTTTTTPTLAPLETITVTYPAVAYDDLNAQQSTTQFKLSETGDYLFVIAQMHVPAASDGMFYLTLYSGTDNIEGFTTQRVYPGLGNGITFTVPVRCTDVNKIYHVKASNQTGANMSLQAGTLNIVRIGAGPTGPAGPQGPEGAVGPQGIQGPQGPAGASGSGYNTYGELNAAD